MSDIGEIFSEMREIGKERRRHNLSSSIQILKERGIEFITLSDIHLRIGDYDFWPSTGKFWNRKTNKYGRGVFNLLNKIKS